MSATLLVQSILDDAAKRFGDSTKKHFTDPLLLDHYNDTLEDMTTRWQMLEGDADFPWIANEDRYAYPDDCVQMLRLQYNPTGVSVTVGPTDQNQWRKVDEAREWQYVAMTDGSKPPGDDKRWYWARTGFFVTYPVPVVSLYLSGRIGYWKQADRQVTATTRVNAAGQQYSAATTEMPNTLRRVIRDGMVITMKESLSRHEEASIDRAHWERTMDGLAPRITDPVDDERESFRPALPGDGRGGGWLDGDSGAV